MQRREAERPAQNPVASFARAHAIAFAQNKQRLTLTGVTFITGGDGGSAGDGGTGGAGQQGGGGGRGPSIGDTASVTANGVPTFQLGTAGATAQNGSPGVRANSYGCAGLP